MTGRKSALDAAREANQFFRGDAYDSPEAPVMPQRLFKELLAATDDNAIFTLDAGENRLFMVHYSRPSLPAAC